MSAKRPVVAVVVLLLCLSAVTATGQTDSTVHTVSEGESIQAAVDAAEPGDTVRIEAGIYQEHVTVDVRNLTITGDGDAVIEGFRQNETVVNVTADSVRIENLTVTGGVGKGRVVNETRTPVGIGIRVYRADDVELVDLRVADNDGWGIYVLDGEDALVARNELVHNVWDGVIVVRGDGAVVRNNNASDNGLTVDYWHQRHGIRFTSTSDGHIVNNTATDNAYAGVLFTNEATNNTVRGNVMRGNRKRGFGTFGPSRNNTIVDNRIVENSEYGILSYTPGGDNRYVDNTVRNNDGNGILLHETGGDVVRRNRIVDNDWIGLSFNTGADFVVANNTIADNNGVGVSIGPTTDSVVADNRVSGTPVGVRVLRESEGLKIVDNRLEDTRYGVGVDRNATEGVTLAYNDVAEVERYGVVVFGGYRAGFDDGRLTDVVTADREIPSVDARRNYWGAASGPSAPSNPNGTGANVTANVVVEPWLDASTDAPANLTGDVGGTTTAETTTETPTSTETTTAETTTTTQEPTTATQEQATESETTDPETTDPETTEDAAETSDTSGTDGGSSPVPGFGPVAALVALVIAVAVRRARETQ